MSIITENIDAHPYTGTRQVKGRIRIKTEQEAPYLNGYFNGNPRYEQITGITRGKIYDVIKVEGYGDCEDITIIDDNNKEQRLGQFFFEKVD